jgi:hypothetical protein
MNVEGFQDSQIIGCRFQDISGICIDLGQFTGGAPYQPDGGVVSDNQFSGTIGTIVRMTNTFAKPTVFTQNIVDGAATTGLVSQSGTNLLAYDNYVTGSVSTPQSGSSASQTLTTELNNYWSEWITVRTSDGNLAVGTSQAQSPWTTQGRNEKRAASEARNYFVNGYKDLIDDGVLFDTIQITSPGGFGSANYNGFMSGKLRISFSGINSLNQPLFSSRSYVIAARQAQNGNITISVTALAAEDIDDGSVSPTIVVQAKAGATPTSAILEASITFANFNSTFKPECTWSYEADSLTTGIESTSLLKVE